MLQRRYTSIAEESDSNNTTAETKRSETTNGKNLIKSRDSSSESSTLLLPRSARMSTSTSELTEDVESESDRYSLSDDDYIFGDENENKSSKKEKGEVSEKNNNYLQQVSKHEEDVVKSAKLSPDQIREIKEAFHVFDNNGDGCITATELKKLVTSLGYNITEAELMDMMNQIDSDGNGAIDFPEFLALMTKNLEDCDPEDILLESFKVFDRDGSGFIGVSELDRVFKLLGQDFKDYEIEAMIKAADADGDGLVGWDDFTKMMNV